MRVLRTLTGKVAHLPARNAEARSFDAFPACTPVGTAVSNGVTRFYFHTADAATCKRCLAILDKAETEARAMHAQHMMTPEGQAQEDALAARRMEKCAQCGERRSKPRHHFEGGHAFVDRAAELVELLDLPARETGTHGDADEPTAEQGDCSGMYVELATGKQYVQVGDRLRHPGIGRVGTVVAVGPNALDINVGQGGTTYPWSGASWFWMPVPHTQKCRDNAEAATCDGSCAAPPAAEGATPEPHEFATLAGHVAHQAELFANGLVCEAERETFRLGMVANVTTLAVWLGMSTPAEMRSFPSVYGGADRVAEVRRAREARDGQDLLCRSSSRRWTTYGARCSTPLNGDGTCPEQRDHV